MSILTSCSIALVAAILLAVPGTSRANPITIIDQQHTVGTTISLNTDSAIGNGFGQSFTVTLDRIDAFEMFLISDGTTTGRLDLFAGNGFGGTLLGSSSTVSFGNVLQMVHFDLTLALTPGNVYTARVVRTAGDAYTVAYDPGGGYAGGQAFDSDGTPTVVDLRFAEGLHAAAVPEPASLLLVGAGLLGLAVKRQRRRA